MKSRKFKEFDTVKQRKIQFSPAFLCFSYHIFMKLKDRLPDSIRARLFQYPQDNGDIIARCALYKELSVSICPEEDSTLSTGEMSLVADGVIMESEKARDVLKQALNTPGLNIFVCDEDCESPNGADALVMHVVTPVSFPKPSFLQRILA